jgi:hypothetical protein
MPDILGSQIDKVTDLVGEIGDVVDDNIESGEERQNTLSARHRVDMMSDSRLSKSVRPITLLYLLSLMTIIVVVEFATGTELPYETKILVGGPLAAAIGFYFDSKKRERVSTKNAEANIRMRKLQLVEKIKADRRADRKEERDERRERRLQRIKERQK